MNFGNILTTALSPVTGLMGGNVLNPTGNQNQNPADQAQQYLNKIPGTIKPYYDPYIDAGRSSLDTLMGQYNQLVSDPGAVMQLAGGGFQQSPGYQYQVDEAMRAANNAAASGGMLGTPYHQFNASSMASDLANQDYHNYLDRALGLYRSGMQGYGDVNQMGYGASNELANSLGANLMNQANMSYLGQSNQNQTNTDLFNTIMKGAGAALPFFI